MTMGTTDARGPRSAARKTRSRAGGKTFSVLLIAAVGVISAATVLGSAVTANAQEPGMDLPVTTTASPNPTALSISLSVKDWPLITDPSTSGLVQLDIAVKHRDGTPAAGAAVRKTRNGRTVDYTASSSGELHLIEPVRVSIPANVSVAATWGHEGGSASTSLYSVNSGPVCHLDGKPERLNSLRNLLNQIGLPTLKPVFDGWISAAGLASDFIPARYATTLSGYTFSGPGLSTLYELQLKVRDLRSNETVASSDLFSRNSVLLDPLTGRGLSPLQAFARQMRCGVLA
jgi:hypothetical protein